MRPPPIPIKSSQMSILFINPSKGYWDDIIKILIERTNHRVRNMYPIIKPFNKRILNKKKTLAVLFWNLAYFWLSSIRLMKHDIVILSSHGIAIPLLIMYKLFPFLKPRKNIIIALFYLHEIGEYPLIRRFLKFIFYQDKIILLVQSPFEKQYYLQLLKKIDIVYYPFCQGDFSVTGDCGKNEDYIFSGGFTNRDYQSLLKAVENINGSS